MLLRTCPRLRLLETAVYRRSHSLGNQAARPFHAAALRAGRLQAGPRTSAGFRLRFRGQMVQDSCRVPLPHESGPSQSMAWKSSFARLWSPGTCSPRRPPSGGTGRSVDSSLERMQIKVTRPSLGGPLRRHMQTNDVSRCCLLAILERPSLAYDTGQDGLSAALHPTIPVHTPLTFDLIDTWKKRSVGRCIYYAGPPDGRVHTTRPVDAVEASSRRLERFQLVDPSPKPMEAPEPENNPVFPMTLDLRWPAPGAVHHTDPQGLAP